MNKYAWGNVVVARYPFSDLKQFKHRPAIVISGAEFFERNVDIAIIAVTSQLGSLPQDYWLQNWQSVGLTRPSAFKPHIATLDRSFLLQNLGMLSSDDQNKLKQLLSRLLGLSS